MAFLCVPGGLGKGHRIWVRDRESGKDHGQGKHGDERKLIPKRSVVITSLVRHGIQLNLLLLMPIHRNLLGSTEFKGSLLMAMLGF